MSAKKSDFGLIIKLLVALAIGAFLGRMANVEVMDAVASVKYALGQIIFYAVPLVIVGFITPAIARLGQNASKMLLTAVAIAYLSSVGAAAFSAASGYAIIPHLSVPTEVSGLVDLPKPSFVLDIPPLMSVMSALVTALLLGLAVSWTKAEIINKALAELEAIMTSVVTRVIIPILPFFVGATFCELSYE
ncbi:MAG: cation:dicarboxylate symporter family transporter, partial [Bilophila wadsworthia]